METILVWYFLTSSVVTIGPFSTEEQCNKMKEWAFKWKYVSDCWQAPLAQRLPHSIEPRVKSSPDVR